MTALKKAHLMCALLLGSLLVSGQAIAEEDKDVATLKAAYTSYLAAISAFDAGAVAAHTEGRYLFMPNKNIWPAFFEKKEMVERVLTGVLSNRIRFTVDAVQADYVVAGDTGIISGILRYDKVQEEQGKLYKEMLYARFTTVWTKVNGEWKILVDNSQYVSDPGGHIKR